MSFFKALICFTVTIAVAFILGKTDHEKNPEAFAYSWIGSIVGLLILAGCL